MKRILIKDLRKYLNKEVLLFCWVEGIRKIGRLQFFILRDRSGQIQGICDKEIENLSKVEKSTVCKIWGKVKEESQAPKGMEVVINKIEILSLPKAVLPFEYYRDLSLLNLRLDTILDYRPLSLRNIKIGNIFRIKQAIVKCFRTFLEKHDFLEVHTPKIVASGTEGGTQLFKIEYFDKVAYLAQSPQFYKQMLVGAGFERVYEVGFVYRAEDHETSRHLNEYLSLDLEMGFIEDEDEVMTLEVKFLKYLFKYLRKNYSEILKDYQIELEEIKDIPRIPFYEAKEILKKEYNKEEKGDDLSPEEERLLCDYSLRKYGTPFVFITKFPTSARPFYTMPDTNPVYSRGFDLLYKGMEITTGSQRIHDYDMLYENIKKFGYNPENFRFYLEIFKYGMPPHGGLAIGCERLTQQLLNLKNIREASLFPRDRYRVTP
uniref:Aspartate--tRNA(Asp/Asn) ligase n=1 Tax=candidate division WOR-3 bacterium TaxID=2052148 RepID=A0A7V4E3K9_UNCW3